ncbi:MAG: glycosyltransferase [Candidatus Promineifilaceae bacterium]|nr:glycosyltransferase [Candidatus Promineifilaceae bacterium]
MHIVMFYHSLLSDWNHGNAHFLRGLVSELLARGNRVDVYEPVESWSRNNLVKEYGLEPIEQFRRVYPDLQSEIYDLKAIDLDRMLDGADLVLVHEWNRHRLVRWIGEHRARGGSYRLLFHDTHHRSVTKPEEMAGYDLRHYDGVLAFGELVRDLYLKEGWAQRAWAWHEAADTRIFHPLPRRSAEGDLVWIGNWGDGERSDTLRTFLFEPIAELGLEARVHGVRYPDEARAALEEADIEYAGWLPNYQVPEVFARFAVTVHVPRRPYLEELSGVPTIRPFEALACGIPLISAQWQDGNIFKPGRDYLVAHDQAEMKQHLRAVLNDRSLAGELAANGLETIRAGHTCAHRIDELMAICRELGMTVPGTADRPIPAD